MFYFILVLLILDALILAAVILLQAGQGGGLASLGGSGATDTVMGGRQAVTLLTRMSWWCGGIFLALSLVLSVVSANRGVGGRSELQERLRQGAALEGLDADRLGRITIAYEPVWAIGTGRNATPRDAASVHTMIRAELATLGCPGRVPVLYGGSVNLGNALSLLAEEEIDGVLVGGASLEADGWAELVGIGA